MKSHVARQYIDLSRIMDISLRVHTQIVKGNDDYLTFLCEQFNGCPHAHVQQRQENRNRSLDFIVLTNVVWYLCCNYSLAITKLPRNIDTIVDAIRLIAVAITILSRI